MKQYKVGIVGATGMVGQRFSLLLENHPWFEVVALAASARNKGKTYAEACEGRWKMTVPMPDKYKDMVMYDATADAEEIASKVDFIFCAVDMKKDEIRALEEKYAKLECPVCSNNSAHRFTPDVPMIIPEINADHAEIIPAQRKRLGTKRGFIAVKSNCSIQSYVPALSALMDFEPTEVSVCTYQAISGAGKTFETWPEMVDNVIPYIGGEEEKSEKEDLGPHRGRPHRAGNLPRYLRAVPARCLLGRPHGCRFRQVQEQAEQGSHDRALEQLQGPRTGTEPAVRSGALPHLLRRG